MNEIGSTKNFRVAVDKSKNRMLLVLSGDAVGAKENQDAPLIVQKACTELRPGFTCLGDQTQLKLFALPDIAREIMKVMMNAGVGKVASVWAKESFSKVVVGFAAKATGDEYLLRRKSFTDIDSAKAWLDEQSVPS